MIGFLSSKHANGEAKFNSKTDGTLSHDSKCWETIQIGKYRLVVKNQYEPFNSKTEVDIYNWSSYNPSYPSGTTFSLTQE